MARKQSGNRDPWPVALRILARQDRSSNDLRRRLLERGFDPEQVEPVLDRCRELGYLDDLRYAEQSVRSLLASGRAYGRRLELELKKRGLSTEIAQQAIDAATPEIDPQRLIKDLAARRYPGFVYANADPREKRRVLDFFRRRGYTTGDILQALQADTD